MSSPDALKVRQVFQWSNRTIFLMEDGRLYEANALEITPVKQWQLSPIGLRLLEPITP